MEQAQFLVYCNEKILCYSLSCRPVMEVGWNVKLPVNVCVHYTDAVPPPKQSRMGGILSSSAKHLILIFCNKGGEEEKAEWAGNRREIAAETNWSGSRQTAVLFNTSCCLVDGNLWPEKAGRVWYGFGPQVESRPWVFHNVYSSFSQLLLASMSLCFFLLLA